jgi:hypothetical protein
MIIKETQILVKTIKFSHKRHMTLANYKYSLDQTFNCNFRTEKVTNQKIENSIHLMNKPPKLTTDFH